jgi:hypothetical protein
MKRSTSRLNVDGVWSLDVDSVDNKDMEYIVKKSFHPTFQPFLHTIRRM